ncbi:MAG: hypothetical protein AABX49_02820 [Nanoarchaeota archaeon]
MFKKRGFALVLFIFCLLSINVLAQDFGFDFQFGKRSAPARGGYGAGSGVSNAISSTLDIIFGGIVGPIFNAIEFNFYSAVKLALILVLYLVFSNIFKNFFGSQKMHPKFAKIIAAILSLFSVVFIPEHLLDILFRDLLSGGVGFLLLAAAIAFPLYYLFKWSADNKDNKAVNLVSALLFFILIIVFSELHDQFVYAFNYGFIQTLTSLVVTFGIIIALILFIHRLYMGFKETEEQKRENEEKEGRKEGRKEKKRMMEEKDEYETAKGHASQLVGNLNVIREHIHSLSNNVNQLAVELKRTPGRLNIVGPTTAHSIYSHVNRLVKILEESKGKKKSKVANIISKISAEYDELRHHLEQFHLVERELKSQLNIWRSTNNLNKGYFDDLNKKLKNIDKEIDDLIYSLSEIESL